MVTILAARTGTAAVEAAGPAAMATTAKLYGLHL